ncbi:efflux RND transporter permease subunit [Tenacibaculum piscium]|uniref:efflux RND transporter permease subunit n=1 Tax=Tenacibaculum piscium TaxID=1458515 RepID=UPI001F356E2D|nr:MMPL family transporter [Tenacibaculum piscium]
MKKITAFILNNSKITLLILLIGMLLSIFSIKNNFKIETNLDTYMPKNHPAFIYSDKAEEIFDIRDAIMIAIENKKGIYNAETFLKIKNLTKEIQKLAVVEDKEDVLSLYTADNIKSGIEGLEIEPFFKKIPKSQEKFDAIKNSISTNEMIHKRLVSENGQATLVFTKIKNNSFTPELYQVILAISKKYEDENNTIYVAGQPIVEGTMAILMPSDMQKMFPIVLLLIIVVLFIVLRSIKATIISVLVVLFSSIWTFGLMLGIGIPIYAPSSLIPVMLIAIGVADAIHLFSHLQLTMKKQPTWSKEQLIQNMTSEMFRPVLMTSVTTAVGFLSLLTSDIFPIKYFAFFTAYGVVLAMFFSLILIPACVNVFGLPKILKFSKSSLKILKSSEIGKNEIPKKDFFAIYAEKFSNLILQNQKLVVGITLLILLFFGFGMSKVWINSSFLARFPNENPLVKTDAFVNKNFLGTTTVNVILEGNNADTFKNPTVLKLIDKVTNQVVNDGEIVGGSLSVVDFIKRMNKVLHENKSEFYKVPDAQNLIAQYFLLYEMSGGSDRLWDIVTDDFKTANLQFQLKGDNSKGLNETIANIKNYKEEFKTLGIKLNFAGSGYKILIFNDLILIGQIKSLLYSFILVIILLSFMFKSIKLGFIATIPIILTTVISFGVLGWLNIPLETTTALISSIAIGIGIDYAVHFIDRYKINALKTNDIQKTVSETMAHSGRAISFNAVVVILGFLVLIFSTFKPNKALGIIVALNMLTSFIATVTIMFLVLYSQKIFLKKKK